jgi:ABC-type Na+ efflux pump permease subunit
VRYTYLIGGGVAGVALLWAYLTGRFSQTIGPNGQVVVNWAANAREAHQWLTMIVLIEFVTVMLMAANTAATAISRERESDTMELLLTTPLTSRYIVWGKLRGLVSFTLPLLAVPAATVLLAAIIDWIRSAHNPVAATTPLADIVSALLLPPLLLVYSAFACILGLQMSLKSKRSVQAVISSIGILVVVGFGLSLCAMGVQSGGEMGALITPFTFVTAIFYVLNPADLLTGGYRGTADRATVHGFLVVGTLISLAVYGAFVAGTYRSMVRNFDMIVRKQSR